MPPQPHSSGYQEAWYRMVGTLILTAGQEVVCGSRASCRGDFALMGGGQRDGVAARTSRLHDRSGEGCWGLIGAEEGVGAAVGELGC